MAKTFKPPYPGFGTPVPGYKFGGMVKALAKKTVKGVTKVAKMPDRAADAAGKQTVRGLKAWGKHIKENELPFKEGDSIYFSGGSKGREKVRQKKRERDAMSPEEREYWEARDSAQSNTYRNDNWERFPKTFEEWQAQKRKKGK